MDFNYFNKIRFDIIIKYVNLLCPSEYNSKFSNEYFLEHIFYVLKNFVTWSSLSSAKSLLSSNKYHYKTIHKKHILWSKCDVYLHALNELLESDNIYSLTQNLYIDNTLIINKYGSEDVGYGGGACTKKKYTSLTAVINDNYKVVSIFHNKVIKKDEINTIPHDTNSLLLALDKLDDKIVNKTFIVGDKGYIINQNKIKNEKVIIVTPKKKNQKVRSTPEEKGKLKKRYNIEIWFSYLKNFNRILVRRYKLIQTYMGFVYLGCIINL